MKNHTAFLHIHIFNFHLQKMSVVCSDALCCHLGYRFFFPPYTTIKVRVLQLMCHMCVVLRRHNCNVTQHESCQHLKRLFLFILC